MCIACGHEICTCAIDIPEEDDPFVEIPEPKKCVAPWDKEKISWKPEPPPCPGPPYDPWELRPGEKLHPGTCRTKERQKVLRVEKMTIVQTYKGVILLECDVCGEMEVRPDTEWQTWFCLPCDRRKLAASNIKLYQPPSLRLAA